MTTQQGTPEPPATTPASSTPISATPPSPAAPRRRLTPAVAAIGLVVLAAGAFGVYEIGSATGKRAGHSGACAQSLDLAAAADPLVQGEVAALTLASGPNPLGALAFDDAQGTRTTVAAFAGKTVLLNLWATWCVPCRAEMPALDKLQARLGSAEFAVVPVNIDQQRLDRARGFFKEIGATNLPYYADKSADILRVLNGKGLPTTVLIGRDGCEIGTMAGPAQWDSPDARALIEKVEAAAGKRQG